MKHLIFIVLFSLSFILGCSSTKAQKNIGKPKGKTIDERLAKIPSYERSHQLVNKGINMVKLSSLADNKYDRAKYLREAKELFREAIVLLEKTQTHLDKKDRAVVEERIEQIHGYIITCVREMPQILKDKG